MRTLLLLVALAPLLVAVPARAHQDTVAYSRMTIRANGDVEYALKIPVEDLAESLGRGGHAALDAPEVRAAEELLFRHFQPLLAVSAGGAPCPVQRRGIDVPEDERLYGELRFVFRCPAGAPVTLDYRVFFDVDPGHMGMLDIETPGGTTRAEIIRERMRWEVQTSEDGTPAIRPVDSSAPVAAIPRRPVVAERTAAPARPVARRVFQVVDEPPAKPGRSYRNDVLLLLGVVVVVAAAAGFRATRRHRVAPRVAS